MAYDIGPRIGIEGEKDFREALRNINQQIKTLDSEMAYLTEEFNDNADSQEFVTAKTRNLTKQIEAQEQKVKELIKGLTASTELYGANDTKTLQWAQAVNKANADLTKMRNQLARTGNEMEDLSDETGGLTGKLKDLTGIDLSGGLGKALFVGAAVAGVKELAEGLMGLEESTRQYRSTMGSLEVSSSRMGYSAEQTAETYDRLYQVLGDSQASATATANLQAVGLTQEKTTQLVDSAIGAWAKYGDSIPIESLTEAINETIKTGEVTGTFADVLNWAGQSEDEFNTKLQNANGTAERAQAVLDILSEQGLPNAAEEWRTLNEDIKDANESQNNMEQAMGRMGEALEPAATALRNFGAEVIDWLAGKIEALWDILSKPPQIDSDLLAETNAFIDGSHALGLNKVPFDGYIAELHKGEMVLPAGQAESLRALMTASPQTQETDFSGLAAGMVNGITAAMGGMGGNYRIEIPIVVNGREFSRAIVTDLRTVMKSDPEVTNA